jgi:NADH dehydrogenase/NADH:ubiquinone oxidoreductase subunit G
MPDSIHLTIDGQPVTAEAGTTLLKAAQKIGITIPTICFHDYCSANALCRICVVEVEGARTLAPACIGLVSEGMKVHTQSEKVRSTRRTILEMLASSVDLSEAADIQAYIHEYEADPARFPQSESRSFAVIDDNPMFIRDYARCILCWRCVQVCGADAQYAYAINFNKRGYKTQISTFYEKPLPETTCVFCGQCIGVCPTGALKPKREFLLELGYSESEIMAITRYERRQKPRQVILSGGAQ